MVLSLSFSAFESGRGKQTDIDGSRALGLLFPGKGREREKSNGYRDSYGHGEGRRMAGMASADRVGEIDSERDVYKNIYILSREDGRFIKGVTVCRFRRTMVEGSIHEY